MDNLKRWDFHVTFREGTRLESKHLYECNYLPNIPRIGEVVSLHGNKDKPYIFTVIDVEHDINPDAQLSGVNVLLNATKS